NDIAAVRAFKQTGCMQQSRLARTRWCNERDHLAATQCKVRVLENNEFAISFLIGAADIFQTQNDFSRHYSYLRASTGSSLAARHAGKMVAIKERIKAIAMTDNVSPTSIFAGSVLRK